MNEHIGRLQAIGLGKESVSGTQVTATNWFPKMSSNFSPTFEKAVDDSAYGVIDAVANSQTVKNMTTVELEGIATDDDLGHLLNAALGSSVQVQCATITGQTAGTPARGDSISSATGSYTGTIKKLIVVGATTYYYLEELTGTLSDQTDLTNGTWTGGTIDVSTFAAVKGHFFERLNTNAHPSYTFYGSDEVSDEYATYCMMDTLDIEATVGDFAKINTTFKGKKLQTATSQSPSYTEGNAFLAKYGDVKFADNEAGINAATASEVQRFKLTINKNLADVQAFGDDDVASLHNQSFGIVGDLEAIYSATTFRDYVANSTKKACRVSFVNTEATAIYDSTDDIFPSLYIDMARLSFEEWDRSTANDDLVNQTMGFSGEFKAAEAMTIEVLLINTNATGY